MESVSDKACVECKTSKTPLWRSGPAGPKSLCNACGIRYRKKRSIVGSDKKKEKEASSSCSTTREEDCGVDLRKKLRVRLVALGKEVVLFRRQRSPMKKVRRKKLGEVEQAAFLLMSLSCGV